MDHKGQIEVGDRIYANVLLKITDNELATVHECVRAMTTSSA